MADHVLMQYLHEMKDEVMPVLARDAMIYPKADPFEHGVQAGKYQGLVYALEILESVLKDADARDNKR